MHRFIYHNDRVLPLEEVRLSPGQAGLINGWGIFSTVRVFDGIPFALERHYERLARDAGRIQLPLKTSQSEVRDAMQQMLQANRIGNACVRIYFIFNTIGIWKSAEPFPQVDLIMYAMDVPERVGPTTLSVQENGRHAAHPLTGTKVTSWLNNAWMVEQAHRRGYDDALLLNERGEVAECTAANIYCIRGGDVATPPLSSGCLSGVSRAILMEEGPRIGVPVTERVLKLEDFYYADEVFITSTTRHVQPISHIEKRAMKQAPGPVTQKLATLFEEYVKEYLGKAAAAVK
jgi:branched-chain amino acid aminotransferase